MRKKKETKDVYTQVNFENQIIIDLKSQNKSLEELTFNTIFNSGKILTLHDEIKFITVNDELISLRKEFKNLIVVNKDLKQHKKKRYTDKGRNYSWSFCCVIT